MEVRVTLPDELAALLPPGSDPARELLEVFVADAHQRDRLSRFQVGRVLGLDRWQTEAFLASREALQPYDLADLAVDRATLESLK
ncbi:MAG: UPF0175 family protein [Limisphaerales bacterium]